MYDVILERGYDAVSAEVFWNLERGTQTLSKVLKAIALLGSETPAVADLAPLRTVVNTAKSAGIHVHAIAFQEEDTMSDDPGAKLTELARDYMSRNPGARSFTMAVEAVMQTSAGKALCHKWADQPMPLVSPGHTAPVQRNHAAAPDVSAEVDTRAREYLKTHPGTAYVNAVDAVLNGDRALLHRYVERSVR